MTSIQLILIGATYSCIGLLLIDIATFLFDGFNSYFRQLNGITARAIYLFWPIGLPLCAIRYNKIKNTPMAKRTTQCSS